MAQHRDRQTAGSLLPTAQPLLMGHLIAGGRRGMMLALALLINALLVLLLAELNRHGAATIDARPARMAWITLRPPALPHVPPPPPRLLRPRLRQEAPKTKPKVEKVAMKKESIAPRPLKPRPSVMPSLDIHPELETVPLEFGIGVLNTLSPNLLGGDRGYGLDWSLSSPTLEEPGEEAPGPPDEQADTQPAIEDAPRSPTAEIRELDQPPKTVFAPRPRYPLAALRRGVQGFVRIRLHIDAAGRVVEAKVVECEGHSSFARAAREAVQRWRFQPTLRDGQPVPVLCEQKISFRLEG